MARRKNSSSGGGGFIVLLIILGLVSYAGVALLIIGAVVGIIYLIGRSVSNNSTGSSTSASTTTRSTNSTAARTMDSKYAGGTFNKQIPASQVSGKATANTTAFYTDKDAEIIRNYKSKYHIEMVPFPDAHLDPLQNELGAFQCAEVLQSVNRLLNQRINIIKQLNTYSKEIDTILACPNCSDNKEKAKYLQEHESELSNKLSEYNILKGKMKTQKITLMNKHDAAFTAIRNAILRVMDSKKIVSTSGVDFKTFVKTKSTIPGDLFFSAIQPIKLDFGAYKFFLLPEVILVYDKSNVFVTALEPMAMIITSKTGQKNVYMSKEGYTGAWRHSDSLIGDDSVLMREGSVRTSWLHTKKDGGPDRRYSYNPMYQHRSDVYQYGEITIQIGQYKAEYSFSAGNISETIKSQVREYTAIMHELNAAPSLLRLLESASKKKDRAQELYAQYERTNANFICKS